MKAYLYDNLPGDQRLAHDSGRSVDVETLKKLGVLYFHLDTIEKVNDLAAERGYKNRDEIKVSPETMGEAYETKVKSFFSEHLHEDEEIRYIRGGRATLMSVATMMNGCESSWRRMIYSFSQPESITDSLRTSPIMYTLLDCSKTNPSGRPSTDPAN
ncbi:hypothetical protein V2G26_020703 [Clonostachys chloroleuca]